MLLLRMHIQFGLQTRVIQLPFVMKTFWKCVNNLRIKSRCQTVKVQITIKLLTAFYYKYMIYVSVIVPKQLVISGKRRKLELVHIEIQIRSKPSGMAIPDWQLDMIYELLTKSSFSVTDSIYEYKFLDLH